MKRVSKRLTGLHWIAILFAVLLAGIFIKEGLSGELFYPRNLPSTRAINLYYHMGSALDDRPLLKDSYSYFRVGYYYDDNKWLDRIDPWGISQGWHRWKVLLEIGVTDEAVIDEFLASWTGEEWDKLVKVPTDCSITKQEEFIQRAGTLDWGPGVAFYGCTDNRNNFPRRIPSDQGPAWPGIIAQMVLIQGSPAEGTEADWQEMPKQLKDLAKEMGVPEEIIHWEAPTRRAEPSQDIAPTG